MSIKLNLANDRTVIAIDGRFDFELHDAFRECLDEALARKEPLPLEVDLSRVESLESSALGMLLVMRDKAKAIGAGRVALVGCRGFVRQILDVASFSKFFDIR